ncbi:unnamed protein product [Larinioides sclopetarius]|uniref:RNA-directed DNA polymerase n=1 Tax=Larinioides sclopetarius TaxID=280406 RepID=A0AAV2AWD4_9ARAC
MAPRNCKKIDESVISSGFLNSFDYVLTDCDGVLWMGNDAIPGSVETINTLKNMGKPVIYVTNNSTKSRDEYLKKCDTLGFPATVDAIVSTSYCAAAYLQSINFKKKVYIFGSTGIAAELDKAGISHLPIGPDPVADNWIQWLSDVKLDPEVGAVVVGFDHYVSYPKLTKAASYLKDPGNLFIATNRDEQFPTDGDLIIPEIEMLPFARKEELRVVADQIGEVVTQEMKVAELRECILASEAYKTNPESVENFLSSIVEARKRKEEESEKLELENKLEFEKIKLEKAKLEAQLALEKAQMDKEHYIPPHHKRDGPKFRSKDKETKKLECYICGDNHMARNCNKKYSKTDIKRKEAVVAKVNSDFLKPDVNINPLTHVMVSVGGKEIDCIVDSGTQVFVINSRLLDDSEGFDYGKIMLTSAFGENVAAKLIKSTITLPNKTSLNHPLECIIAVTDKLNVDALIPLSLYESLCSLNKERVLHLVADESEHLENFSCEEKNDNVSALSESVDDSDDSKFYSDAIKLKQEQIECVSLETVREQLKQRKGDFILIEGLIFHKDKILSEPVAQLVLPRSRVENVMKLAHESVFGGHMGVRKTKERIRYNFYWPNMSNDITDFVRTCMGCQLRRKNKIGDRAPITPVARPELPFEIVNIDLIGPIEPPSGRGHKYVLCLMDQMTRWPEAVPLRSLSAKATCDALLQIFSRTGIPSVIASDRGTNFTSALTEEFVKRIGSSPRFSCPGYPASNGLVERWNGVLKNMLHHIIREDPRNWDYQIPFLLFAYREVPNITTGVSPFRLMPDRPFIVHSDASQIGVAACLSQRADEKCYPIAYASQKLTKSQQSWSTIEREAFAIVWCLKRFEVWVYGSEIEFYTDHNPLPFLTKSAPQSARLQRWAFALQRYNITIKHCPGAKMPHADALSRLGLNTDILLGTKHGLKTLLVGTGINSLEDVRQLEQSADETDHLLVPDYYLPCLGDLLKFIKA